MCRIAEEHRELCRQHLRLVLDAGYNPMRFFASDYKKYFYLAELYSLIDLSSVSPPPEHAHARSACKTPHSVLA
jgi:hypothetical protein